MKLGRWLTALTAAGALAGCADPAGAPASYPSRQADVAERGRSVMPFDLDRTTHRFTPTAEGLVQEVTVDTPGDTEQLALVRDHLALEAQRFKAGDYADPARIHGSDMPGLTRLSAGADRIDITYAETVNGATIRFRTTDATLVDALHAWGAAQITDHGSHATS